MGLLSATGSRRTAALALAALACAATRATAAPDFTVSVDLRAIAADASPSFLDGGLGKFRYGESGLALGRLRLALDQPIGETLKLHLDATPVMGEMRRSAMSLRR
jgi:hypothetical protein